MKDYEHKKIEKKWQKEWTRKKLYRTPEAKGDSVAPKSFVLDMFPYPSGEGLHVGHPKGYIATDIYSRFKRMSGHSVLHPMGWDAFGLPAENYAIKTKTHPSVAVAKNVKRYKEQLSMIGFDYDWSREINTTDPKYYTWTQWAFLKMLEKGLAYQSFEPINWCPSCQTGLANEDLEDGKCERCGSVVEKKPMRQWTLRITDYAERMLSDLEALDWPNSIKESQKNWIGKSEGAEIGFQINFSEGDKAHENKQETVQIFTTRPETIFGAVALVVSPEHLWLARVLDAKNAAVLKNSNEVRTYIQSATQKTEIDRTDAKKEKTGVQLDGVWAVNPANKEKIPVFVADYVIAGHGTGAVMSVPAHDERDSEFAKKFGLQSKEVIANNVLVNSAQFDGRDTASVRKDITEFVGGKMVTKYKLRDWVFSRQRYWGEPIPVIHCKTCGVVPVPENDLPVKLPNVKNYAPTGTGESPLAAIEKWVNVKCPKCRGKALRETNTMPQWAGSCWYYLRFIDPKNKKALVDKAKEAYWSPVDMYVGGAEHATRHLIYARFWHKFLYDIGAVSKSEPFTRLHNVGLILAEDGRKMSKRFGNVINPDDIVNTYGADTFRVYEMFMGPFSQASAWDTKSIMGSRRFVERVWRLAEKVDGGGKKKTDVSTLVSLIPKELDALLHKTIAKVSADIETFGFNTAISSLMILSREMENQQTLSKEFFETFLKLVAPFAPHVADELWQLLGNKKSIHIQDWPKFDPSKTVSDTVKIVIQVNGKVRDELTMPADSAEEVVVKAAESSEIMKKWLSEATVRKVIFVKNRLVNFVIG
jgi:leucyl-tRNA synthetase